MFKAAQRPNYFLVSDDQKKNSKLILFQHNICYTTGVIYFPMIIYLLIHSFAWPASSWSVSGSQESIIMPHMRDFFVYASFLHLRFVKVQQPKDVSVTLWNSRKLMHPVSHRIHIRWWLTGFWECFWPSLHLTFSY